MKIIQKTNGYTLVSTLVALSLMLLLMILVNKTMPIISGINYNKLRVQAISTAREQMIQTMQTKDFRIFSKTVDHNINLQQEVRTIFSRIYLKITVTYSKTGRELYKLEAYARQE